MSSVGSEVTVRIRNLSFGGDGVGEVCEAGIDELLGITAFVPLSAPGELVQARIAEQKARYVKANILGVLEPAQSRVVPECRYFGTCGGCELQHMDYPSQLLTKSEMIKGQLASARLSIDVINLVEEIVPSQPFHYRRRVSLHIDERGAVGFYRTHSRSVVPIDHCLVSVPEIDRLLSNIQDFGSRVRGRISSLQLEADYNGVVAVMKTPYDLGKVEQGQLLETAKKFFENGLLLSAKGELGGFGRQILELPLQESGSFTLKVPAGYFSQVNWEINRRLIADIVAESQPEGKSICDLYAGAGNFSLPLARNGGRVVAVECDPRLSALARQNISHYRLQRNLQFIESSVEKFLSTQKSSSRFDLLIADPPRSGLGTIPISSLPSTERLFIISCQLPSFVRDLKSLLAAGYEVERIVPYDMFAQTSYVEILATFRAPRKA